MVRQGSDPGRARSGHARRVGIRRHFFVAISAAILAIVLIGFAPTLYLRGLFGASPVPGYLYLHGAVLTAWFAIVAAQTVLIRGGNVPTHRRMGVLGVCVGVAVVVVSVIVTLRFVQRIIHAPAEPDTSLSVVMGFGADAPLLGLAATALWMNLTSLVTFAVLLAGAVLMRDRPDVHKRLMVLASLSILPPAIARISRWPGLGGDMGPLVPIVMLLLLSGMVWFDIHTRRRVHRATLAGGAFVVLGIIASGIVARSDFGLEVVQRLG